MEDMHMAGMGGSGSPALNDSGVDFNNFTQAFDFLQDILDDSVFQVIGNQYARYFWYGVIVMVGIAAVFNTIQTQILKARLHAAAANHARPAKPTNIYTKAVATTFAIAREVTYPHLSPAHTASYFRIPPLGTILLILTYLSFILGLEFSNNNVLGAQHYTALGVRAAWLAVAQVPLLILLVGKNNLIGLLTGVSYERLNVLHRWVGRGLLLLATIHFGTQSYGWNVYGLMQLEWKTDTCPPTGIKAYALLLWLNLTTLAPIRGLWYEFFVIQHILAWFGFIIALMYHIPSTALYSRVWIFTAIGLYLAERIFRSLTYAWHNITPGHATLEVLDGATRITVKNRHIKKWRPGAHVLLSIPRFGIFQSHPATIASIPTSSNGDLVFVLRPKGGFTKQLRKGAKKLGMTHLALIDGPYGGASYDFAAFDTLLLIAASTGVSFTISQLLSIAHRAAAPSKLPLRRIKFLWIVEKAEWMGWVSDSLQKAFTQLSAAGIEIAITVYVTRDRSLSLSDSDSDSRSDSQSLETKKESHGTEEMAPIPSSPHWANGVSKSPAVLTSSSSPQLRSTSSNNSLRSIATFQVGRPDVYASLAVAAEQALGEMAIAVCGPLSLCTNVRTTVARLSDERAVHKGSGAQGIYLHVESLW